MAAIYIYRNTLLLIIHTELANISKIRHLGFFLILKFRPWEKHETILNKF